MLLQKMTIYILKTQSRTIPISLIFSSTIILVLVFETYFHWIITKLMNDYQSFTQFMIHKSINKIKQRGDWILCTISKWLHSFFPLLTAKDFFPFSQFPLTFALLLTIFWTMLTYPHEALIHHIFICQWHDMLKFLWYKWNLAKR